MTRDEAMALKPGDEVIEIADESRWRVLGRTVYRSGNVRIGIEQLRDGFTTTIRLGYRPNHERWRRA